MIHALRVPHALRRSPRCHRCMCTRIGASSDHQLIRALRSGYDGGSRHDTGSGYDSASGYDSGSASSVYVPDSDPATARRARPLIARTIDDPADARFGRLADGR